MWRDHPQPLNCVTFIFGTKSHQPDVELLLDIQPTLSVGVARSGSCLHSDQLPPRSHHQENNQATPKGAVTLATKRILVIDDEGDTLEIIQLCLETIGKWNVVTASSGREGVVQAEATQPDVILLDLIMPRPDGLTTLALLKDNLATKHIPVILYTAASSLGKYLRWAEPELPVKAIIIKPFNLLTLPDKIAAALAEHRS